MGRSYTDIKYDLWYNLEKYGVSPGDIGFATNGNPGSKLFSYGPKPIVGANSVPFKNGALDFTSYTIDTTPYPGISGAGKRFLLFSYLPHISPTRNIIGYGTSADTQMFDAIQISGKVGIHWYGNSVIDQFPNTTCTIGKKDTYAFCYDGTDITSYQAGQAKDTAIIELSTGSDVNLTLNGGAHTSINHADMLLYQVIFIETDIPPAVAAALTRTDLWQPRPDISYFIPSGDTILPIECISGDDTLSFADTYNAVLTSNFKPFKTIIAEDAIYTTIYPDCVFQYGNQSLTAMTGNTYSPIEISTNFYWIPTTAQAYTDRIARTTQYQDNELILTEGSPVISVPGLTAIGTDGFQSDGAWHFSYV